MYGMEKEKKKKFSFDLEDEIHARPARKKEVLDLSDKRSQEIKKILRTGAAEKEFSRLGVLLHGYTALTKVVKRIK